MNWPQGLPCRKALDSTRRVHHGNRDKQKLLAPHRHRDRNTRENTGRTRARACRGSHGALLNHRNRRTRPTDGCRPPGGESGDTPHSMTRSTVPSPSGHTLDKQASKLPYPWLQIQLGPGEVQQVRDGGLRRGQRLGRLPRQGWLLVPRHNRRRMGCNIDTNTRTKQTSSPLTEWAADPGSSVFSRSRFMRASTSAIGRAAGVARASSVLGCRKPNLASRGLPQKPPPPPHSPSLRSRTAP